MDDLPKEAHLYNQRDMAGIRPGRSVQEAVIAHAQSDMEALGPEPPGRGRSGPPSTASVLWATWRQGLKDLQTAVLGAWGGTHEEPGTIANPVQMEVYEDRHNSYDAEISMYAARGRDEDRGPSR